MRSEWAFRTVIDPPIGSRFHHNFLSEEVRLLVRQGWGLYVELIGLEGQVVINMAAAGISPGVGEDWAKIQAEIDKMRMGREEDLRVFYELTGRAGVNVSD